LNIIKEEHAAFFPNPSTDGSFVVYHRVNSAKVREVVLYDLATQKSEVIDEGMSPSLSKDDRYVAYTKNIGGNWDIWRWDRHTKVKTKLTTDKAKDFAPSWRHDGKLVFASDRLRTDEFDFYIFDQGNVSPLLLVRDGSVYAAKFSGNTRIAQEIMPSILGVPRSSFGAIHYNGKIYVAGGHQGREHTYPPESFTNRVEVYDIATAKWKSIAPRNYKCHGFQLAAYGKYVYAFGGFTYSENHLPKWTSLDVIERYDTERNVWEVVGRMPRKRSSNVALTVGTKVYLIGGWDSTPKKPNDVEGTFHNEIDVFDMLNESITTLDIKLPMKRRAFTGIVKDQKIMLIGGISEGGSHFSLIDDVTLFDPQDNSFSTIARLPYPTFAPAAGVIGNELYVFGGMFKTGEWNYEYVSHIYQYTLNSHRPENNWVNTGRTLKESKGFSQVVQMQDTLGILGGHTYMDNQDAPVSTFEWFKLK
jgi:N-acetylneuraminic acid mutarotase